MAKIEAGQGAAQVLDDDGEIPEGGGIGTSRNVMRPTRSGRHV
jgi:hypothetical protein